MCYTTDPLPWKRLAAAVIEQAVLDFKQMRADGWIDSHGTVRTIRDKEKLPDPDILDVGYFFKTKGFERICGILNCDPTAIRDALAKLPGKL